MKLELILPFLMTLLLTVKSEVENNIFTVIDSLFEASTTMQPLEPTTSESGGIIVDIIDKNWWENLIDEISLCGIIAIGAGILCVCLCCCVGGCCWYKKRRSGAASFYEYYQGITHHYLSLFVQIAKSQSLSIDIL